MPFLTDPAYRKRQNRRNPWQVIWYEVDGARKVRRFRAGFVTRTQAARWWADFREQYEAGRAQAPDHCTIEQLISEVETDSKARLSSSSIRAERAAFDRFAKAVGLSTKIADIGPAVIEKFLSGRPTAHTFNSDLRLLKKLFNVAVRWELIQRNPVNGIRQRRANEAQIVHLTRPEQAKLVRAARKASDNPATPFLYPLITLALRTGMRLGELLHLRWGHVDMERRQITVATTQEHATKSRRSRVVGIDDDALAALNWLRSWFDREEARLLAVAGNPSAEWHARANAEYRLGRVRAAHPRHNGHVFPSIHQDGRPLTEIKTAWGTLRDAVFGLERRVRFHDLRHTFAVNCATAGIPLPLLSQLLGHAGLGVTQRYLRFYPDAGAASLLLAVPILCPDMDDAGLEIAET